MMRLRAFLLIAAATCAVLHAYDQGYLHAAARFVAGIEVPPFEPAAGREVTDRPEDAFQRAWNSSETRVLKALAKEGAAP